MQVSDIPKLVALPLHYTPLFVTYAVARHLGSLSTHGMYRLEPVTSESMCKGEMLLCQLWEDHQALVI